MNALIGISLVTAILTTAWGVTLILPPPSTSSGSPQQIYPAYEGPGTGHGFGYDIVYTIKRHTTHGGKATVVVSSGALGEEHVEIWSPIPSLVALPDGRKFRLTRAENFARALRLDEP